MKVEDIEIAEKMCRWDISHLKEKTTRRNPTTTAAMTIAMPKELKDRNKNIMLHINMMCNEIGFMTSTSHPQCS